MKIYAWIGEDELGSGVVGLKQARVPAGYIPLVVIEQDLHKITRPEVVAQLAQQATVFGKEIRLAEFEMTPRNVMTLTPVKG